MIQVRHAHLEVVSPLDDDVVLIIVPARPALDCTAEVVDSLGRHVAELFLLVRDEAGPGGVRLRIAELSGAVLPEAALDDARVRLEALREPFALPVRRSASQPHLILGRLGHRRGRDGRVSGKDVAALGPVVHPVWVRLGVVVQWRVLATVVVEVTLGRVVAVKLGPVHLEASCREIAVSVDPRTEDVVGVVDAGRLRASIVPPPIVMRGGVAGVRPVAWVEAVLFLTAGPREPRPGNADGVIVA